MSRRPALNATDGGSKGESPRAISSALRNLMPLSSRVRISAAKVVFPAPLGPVIRNRMGFGLAMNQFTDFPLHLLNVLRGVNDTGERFGGKAEEEVAAKLEGILFFKLISGAIAGTDTF